MKAFIVSLCLFSSVSMAADCTHLVSQQFSGSAPKMMIKAVTFKGILNPGEERPYLQSEIWNDSKSPLDIYQIDASYMAKFSYVALVSKQTCKIHNLIEVLFE